MPDHYVTAMVMTGDGRTIIGGCRCGWAFQCGFRAWPAFFAAHRDDPLGLNTRAR